MVGSSLVKILGKENSFQILPSSRDDTNLFSLEQTKKKIYDEKPNIIINAAAMVGGIHANNTKRVDFIINNLKINMNILEASILFPEIKIVNLGSSCIYPRLSKQPIKEEYLLEGQLEKTNEYYAIAKIAGIKLCESLNMQYNFDSISLMPTNLYGPGDNYNSENSHVMAALIKKFCDA